MRITRRTVLAAIGAALVVPKALGRLLGGRPKQAKDITAAEIEHWAQRLESEYAGAVSVDYWANGEKHLDIFNGGYQLPPDVIAGLKQWEKDGYPPLQVRAHSFVVRGSDDGRLGRIVKLEQSA